MHHPKSADLSSLLALDVLTLIVFDTCRYFSKPFAWYCCFDGQRQTHCHLFSIVYFVITPTAAHPSQSVYVLTEEPHPQISPMILMVPVDGHFETTASTMGARFDTISMEAQSRAGRISSSAKAIRLRHIARPQSSTSNREIEAVLLNVLQSIGLILSIFFLKYRSPAIYYDQKNINLPFFSSHISQSQSASYIRLS